MTASIQALREQRNVKATALTKMVEDSAGKDWTGDNQTAYAKLVAEIDADDAHIARVQMAIDKAAAAGDVIDATADKTGKKPGLVKIDDEKARNTFGRFVRNGWKGLTPDEVVAEAARIRNAQAEGTNSAGGYLVPTTTVAELLVELKMYGGMRDASTIVQTASGEVMNWPTLDDTGNVGELVAENAAAASQDATFGTVGVTPYKFSSKIFAVPFELLQDSVIDVEAIVNSMAMERIGRKQNTYFTTGTGTSQPKGVVVAAASGKVGATGQTASIIYTDLVDLEHSVDPAYRRFPGVGYMMADSTLKALKKLVDGNSRPLWMPGLDLGTLPGGTPGTICGYQYWINQDVAAMATNAKSLLFGNFKRYLIRDVMQMQMFRFDDSAYIANGQIGFLMWARAGGNFVASSNSSMKYYANSAS